MQVAFHLAESAAFAPHAPSRSPHAAIVSVIADVVPAHRRHCRILLGSVPTYVIPTPDRYKVMQAVGLYPARWRGLIEAKLFRAAVESNDLCAIVVDGLSASDAAAIDGRWHSAETQGYIGAFQLLRGESYDEALYLMSLPPRYHLHGRTLEFLVDPSGEYDSIRFEELSRLLPRHGIDEVKLRDTGVTETIFDPYDTDIEFARIAGRVERLLGSYIEGIITEICLRARQSDPRLLETLHAALDALERDAGREFRAQAALSCRRFLERLADVVYPPRPPIGDRKVGREQYVNRLWMYLEERLEPTEGTAAKKEIGARIEYLARVANKGLHADVTVDEVHRLVLNLALLTRDLLTLTPPTGKPSESYAKEQEQELFRFLLDREK